MNGRPVNLRQRKRVIRRLVALMDACRTRRYVDVCELAREHECSDRTIRRDLEAMEECGVRVPRWRQREAI